MLLQPSTYYHLYNRANGWEKIFLSEENYRFFLEKYQLYVSPYVYTYCYCLMPNHFHFLIQVKEEDEVLRALQNLQGFAGPASKKNLEGLRAEAILSQQLSKFFNSYAKAFNKQQNRRGSLFMKNFKRKIINDQLYFKNLVHYIHYNPVEAKLCSKPENWKHSSYYKILQNDSNLIDRDKILDWFNNDIEEFKSFHQLSVMLQEMD